MWDMKMQVKTKYAYTFIRSTALYVFHIAKPIYNCLYSMLNAFHSEQTSAVPDGIRRAILAFYTITLDREYLLYFLIGFR